MISVCIATYNGEEYIQAQLDSILPQLGEKDEIIVSDDGSTDNTLQIIRNYNDYRIKVFTHEKYNKFREYPFFKITKNIENAINQSSGDLIFLADQDDIWVENKVKIVSQEMKENWVLLHDCTVVNETGEIQHDSYYLLNNSKTGFLNNLINCSYLGCCMAFKREILKVALPIPNVPIPHDLWLGLIADYQGRVKRIDNKLLLYRRHSLNASSSSNKSSSTLFYKLTYRIIVFFSLLKRVWLRR